MDRHPINLRALARRDVESAIDYYIEEAGSAVAARFIGALEAAYRLIGEHPSSGSPRYAHELALPGLRCLPLKDFPWLVFYVARGDDIDVWRVLHTRRDIPAWMHDPES
ncbi:MAG TPA: type II toxin-antitoxin system RelE/ParE family toxin [Bradyrhizobium sp.]|nr:type II toxin-antitoxin system RelE/ParE family toxin [Bradyrhizobium sp.]